MFGQNSALLIAWLGLSLGIINLVWNIAWALFKFWFERRDKVGLGLTLKYPGKICLTVANLGQVPRFFEGASIVWKEKRGSFGAIVLDGPSNSKEEPTAVMDKKTFECPLDRNHELEEVLKTKKKIGVFVFCRDGRIHQDFGWWVREGIRMFLDWSKRGVLPPP